MNSQNPNVINSKHNIVSDVNIENVYLRTNGLEKEIDAYKEAKLKNIKFTIISKHILVSLIALLVSFFLDISYVPIIGNVSMDLAKSLFPQWIPINQGIKPLSFWWLPVITYAIFILFAYKAYRELRHEVKQSTSPDIIDRIIGSSISVIDGIATALPLLGAALLLISIKLGPEVFLGLSVPFEIKALIVLALGKLFEPVFEEMAVEFQHIINKANEIKTRYYEQKQVEHFQKVIKQLDESRSNMVTSGIPDYMSISDLKQYESVLASMTELSRQMQDNFTATYKIMEQLKGINAIDSQKIAELKNLSETLLNASTALKDESTLKALKSLELIVVKKQ